MISHHAALIYIMVLVAASDRRVTDSELQRISEIIGALPVFADYDRASLTSTAEGCADLLDRDDGLDEALALIEAALPTKLRETAYALACDVAAADEKVPQEEARMLQLIRYRLNIDRLIAAGIERGARARFTRL